MDPTLLKTTRKCMEEAEMCLLTTLDNQGHPYTRALFNLLNKTQFPEFIEFFASLNDDFPIFLGTNTSSQKITHIRKNPAVCVYYCKPTDLHGVMFSGDAVITDDPSLKHRLWLEGWTRYYPGGPEDPDFTILSIKPRLLQGWYRAGRIDVSLKEKP